MVGSRHVLRLGDGWYAGFDGGEFGGGLWWFSADGSNRNKLLDENIVGFAQGSGKAYAFSGLNHMGTDFGNVYQVHPNSHTVTHFATLGAEPHAFAVESNDSIIAVTSRHVLTVKPGGYVQELAKRNFVPFAPNSIAQSGDGDIYIGMNFFVLRFVRHGATYDEQWLMPAGCRGFRIEKDDCRCE